MVKTTAGLVELAWTPVPGTVTGYTIERTGERYLKTIEPGLVTKVSDDVKCLPYTFRIAAKNGASTGPWSNTVESKCPCTSAPGVPTLSVKRTKRLCKEGGLEFSYTPPSDAALCVSAAGLRQSAPFEQYTAMSDTRPDRAPARETAAAVFVRGVRPHDLTSWSMVVENSFGKSASKIVDIICEDPGWTPTTWQADADIAVGKSGELWFINGTTVSQLTPKGPKALRGVAATRIAVDPNGIPWIVKKDRSIAKWTKNKWMSVAGKALDIGIGADGTVWILDKDGVPATWTTKAWQKDTSGVIGRRISVGPDGAPWIVDASNAELLRRNPSGVWEKQGVTASDISIGTNGTAYAVAGNEHQIQHWDPGTSSWVGDPEFDAHGKELVSGHVVAAGDATWKAWVGRRGEPVLVRSQEP